MSHRSESKSIAPKGSGTKDGKDYVYWQWDHDYSEGDSYISAPAVLYLYDDNTWEGSMADCKNKYNPATLGFYFVIDTTPVSILLKVTTRNTGEGGAASASGELEWDFRNDNASLDIRI